MGKLTSQVPCQRPSIPLSRERRLLHHGHAVGQNLPSSRIEATSDIAYVRFNGQNKVIWEGKASWDQRYDYEYRDEELKYELR